MNSIKLIATRLSQLIAIMELKKYYILQSHCKNSVKKFLCKREVEFFLNVICKLNKINIDAFKIFIIITDSLCFYFIYYFSQLHRVLPQKIGL